MVADLAWIVAVMSIAALIAIIGAIDFYLMIRGEPTITLFLRSHPGYFWLPVVILEMFLTGLAVHLFGLK